MHIRRKQQHKKRERQEEGGERDEDGRKMGEGGKGGDGEGGSIRRIHDGINFLMSACLHERERERERERAREIQCNGCDHTTWCAHILGLKCFLKN